MDEITAIAAVWKDLIAPNIERASYVAAFCEALALFFLYRDRQWIRNSREADRVEFTKKQEGWIKSGLDLALIVEKNTAVTKEANELTKQQTNTINDLKVSVARLQSQN